MSKGMYTCSKCGCKELGMKAGGTFTYTRKSNGDQVDVEIDEVHEVEYTHCASCGNMLFFDAETIGVYIPV